MEVVQYTPLISFNWTFVMVLITFGVLYLILKKLFYEKIRKLMMDREQKVIDQFDNAEAAEKLAESNLAAYKDKLDKVEAERRGILKEAKTTADQRSQQIIEEANLRASEIVKQAEKETERQRQIFAESMRDQVAMLAVFAAEKIIEKELDEKEQLMIVDEIISKNGGKAWTN